MAEMDFDDQLVRDYLAECREHLSTIENDLLEMERSAAEIDEELVNRVFRAAHSIKGGAGFFDLVKIRDLAHKTESVLDLVRSRQMTPTPEVVSILLLSFDKLRDLLDHYTESNQTEIADFVSALARLATDHLSADQKLSAEERVVIAVPRSKARIEISAFDLAQARRGGKSVYLIGYDLIHDIQRRGKAPYEVLKSLLKSGSILETVLDLDAVGMLDDEPASELWLEILYATALEPDLIGELIDAPADRIWVLEKNDALKRLDAVLAPAPAPAPAPVIAPCHNPEPVVHAAEPSQSQTDATVRLRVALLDSLMTLAGELVLSRNQLNESLSRGDERAIRASAQRVSLVTSELQEVVTLTRMQPVGNLFGKFPRLVRDLARNLNKEVQLQIEGADVELDKTILESLSDPLTHMVRNSVDHGIETRQTRADAGKPSVGTVTLKASHQAGQVVIEVSDDGKGLDPQKIAASCLAHGAVTQEELHAMTDREKMALILLPGVSTAETVSDVSGRGVGMDVVKTNLDKLGGKMEIDSIPGRGASFRIKLPLTLAIIPSLLISDGGERFALPQVNVGELIRIPAGQIPQRVDRVGESEVLILRDRLVPLLRLPDALGFPRPDASGRAINVVLVDTGTFEYGLVVEQLHETVEIVVKPLGRHLKGLADYAGATILGDGRVAVILDVAGLAARANLSTIASQASSKHDSSGELEEGELFSLLLFHNAPAELCAVPIDLVSRIERVRPAQIEFIGGRRTMQYRGASVPVITLADVAAVGSLSEGQPWIVIIFEHAGRALGLLAAEPLDMLETRMVLDRLTLRQPGIAGSAVLKQGTTLIVDIVELVRTARPEWWEAAGPPTESGASAAMPTVLLAEDSDFFREQLRHLIEAVGCPVIAAPDGQAAWEMLDAHAMEIGLVTTDIEMPRMDGLTLTRRIRADQRFRELPVIAISTLAGEEEVARGIAAGVTEYQIKLNKDELLNSIRRVVGSASQSMAAAHTMQEKER